MVMGLPPKPVMMLAPQSTGPEKVLRKKSNTPEPGAAEQDKDKKIQQSMKRKPTRHPSRPGLRDGRDLRPRSPRDPCSGVAEQPTGLGMGPADNKNEKRVSFERGMEAGRYRLTAHPGTDDDDPLLLRRLPDELWPVVSPRQESHVNKTVLQHTRITGIKEKKKGRRKVRGCRVSESGGQSSRPTWSKNPYTRWAAGMKRD